jgi:hypothetical protein
MGGDPLDVFVLHERLFISVVSAMTDDSEVILGIEAMQNSTKH